MASNKIKLAIMAWFIFSLSGQSLVEESKLVSSQPYRTRQECVAVARVLQGPSLLPFYYCVGSEQVSELPPLMQTVDSLKVQSSR